MKKKAWQGQTLTLYVLHNIAHAGQHLNRTFEKIWQGAFGNVCGV